MVAKKPVEKKETPQQRIKWLEKEVGRLSVIVHERISQIGTLNADNRRLNDLLHIEQEENNANIDALAKKQEECEGLFHDNQQLRIINGSLTEENTSLEQTISALRHEIAGEKEDRERRELELLGEINRLEIDGFAVVSNNEKISQDLAVVAESLRRTKEKLDDYVFPCQAIERMLDERVDEWRTLFSSESPMLSASLVISEIFDQTGKAEVLEERIAEQARVIRERDAEVLRLSRPWWKKMFGMA